MYTVTYKKFKDLSDNHIYSYGDIFPYDNREIDKKRIDELSSKNNKIGVSLIQYIDDENQEFNKKINNDISKNKNNKIDNKDDSDLNNVNEDQKSKNNMSEE